MAPKKKYKGPKSAASSPNVILVVFLILFILTSIGLGVSTYYGFEGQKKLKDAAKAAQAKVEAIKKELRLQEYFRQEAMKQIGLDLLPKDGAYDEEANWKSDRQAFLTGSMNADSIKKYKPHIDNLIATGQKYLNKDVDGVPNPVGYTKTWKERVDDLRRQVAALENARKAERARADSFKKNFAELATLFEPEYSKLANDQRQELKNRFTKITNALDEMKKEWVKAQKIEDLRTADQLKFADERRGLREKIRQRDEKILALEKELLDPAAKLGGGGGGFGPKRKGVSGSQPYALMLDVSKGRPLWDLPKGKIIRVDNKTRKVFLDVGTEDGVQNGLTFTVFPAGEDGQARGFLKGMVEVFNAKVTNSEAKITAMYTKDGIPIPLGRSDALVAKRMSEHPMTKGDLLYNMAWNARVALAGKFNISGRKSFSAAQDEENMKRFMQFLDSQNIKVDAYVNPRDGKIVGKIVPSTRFLIVGDLGHLGKGLAVDNPEHKKAAEALLKGIAKIRAEAIDRGMFIVSQPNFTALIGYQPPRSEESVKVPEFVPSPIRAGRYLRLSIGEVGGGGPGPIPMKK